MCVSGLWSFFRVLRALRGELIVVAIFCPFLCALESWWLKSIVCASAFSEYVNLCEFWCNSCQFVRISALFCSFLRAFCTNF